MNAAPKTPLTLAIRKHMPRLVAAATDYKTNVATVDTYLKRVRDARLPIVTTEPKDWQDYVTAWEKAVRYSFTYYVECMVPLSDVPKTIQGLNNGISALLAAAIDQANVLIKNPQDSAALAALTGDLTQITTHLGLPEMCITSTIDGLNKFQTAMSDTAKQLQSLSSRAAVENQADRAQINALQGTVKDLQDEIESLTKHLTALGIADAVAITLGTVAVDCAGPWGMLTWIVLAPVVAVATKFIVLDTGRLVNAKNQLGSTLSQMSQLTMACAALATLSTSFGDLADQSQTTQPALEAILAAWQAMASDIGVAITDAQTAITDQTAGNFQAVLTDLQGAQNEWQATDSQAASLALDLQVNNAPLQVGMSQSAVGNALKGGKTMSLIEYFNSVGAARSAA